VRTAFPTTGGFDEQVTLFCLHPIDSSSRIFSRFLAEIADLRSVYAPDLPGYGESDAAPNGGALDGAAAISDLAHDLRLRQIDLLGVGFGAVVAAELAASRPELVRRLVLAFHPDAERTATFEQQRLILGEADGARVRFETDPKTLAKQISAFLSGRA